VAAYRINAFSSSLSLPIEVKLVAAGHKRWNDQVKFNYDKGVQNDPWPKINPHQPGAGSDVMLPSVIGIFHVLNCSELLATFDKALPIFFCVWIALSNPPKN